MLLACCTPCGPDPSSNLRRYGTGPAVARRLGPVLCRDCGLGRGRVVGRVRSRRRVLCRGLVLGRVVGRVVGRRSLRPRF